MNERLAGRTALVKRLERACHAARFSHDEWMSRLYGADPPARHFANSAALLAK